MIEKQVFGTTKAHGEQVLVYTLTAGAYSMKVSTYGGILLSLIVPDAQGNKADVVLGFSSLAEYEKSPVYMGALIGRYANRISGGSFTIDGNTYQVPRNERGVNALHGGPEGFDTKVWHALTSEVDGVPAVHLSYTSVSGEMGFPGTVKVHVDYVLHPEGKLEIIYAANTDATTPVNLTNHSYFNLAGDGGTILNHQLQLYCDAYLPFNDNRIPTGEIKPVAETPFDFTSAKPIGTDIEQVGGYDHCFVLSERGDTLKECAYVVEPESGRSMRVLTTMEAVQFFSGNTMNGSDVSRDGIPYMQHSGFCLETQHFPDAMNHENFPNCLLKPNETYRHTTILKFNV